MQFSQIVFMQNDDAIEPLEIIDRDGIESAVEYLAQWDNGEDDDVRDYPSAGTSDHYGDVGQYRITWNAQIGYIGLERIIKKERIK